MEVGMNGGGVSDDEKDEEDEEEESDSDGMDEDELWCKKKIGGRCLLSYAYKFLVRVRGSRITVASGGLASQATVCCHYTRWFWIVGLALLMFVLCLRVGVCVLLLD